MPKISATHLDIDSVKLSLASPEQIRLWSYGEVKTQETINYRTLKPEKDGLFCEKIFGTTKDWECQCGKFKSSRYKGVICDRCGVEVTHSKLRRERMGSIELVSPVAHVWVYKSVPSKLGDFLGISGSDLRSVLLYDKYIVVDPGNTDLKQMEVINKREYEELEQRNFEFTVGKGAEIIKQLLMQVDLDQLIQDLRKEMKEKDIKSNSQLLRRLEMTEQFRHSGNHPSWMILDVIPVIPPDLRPMVQLDGGRFATSDLNDLYRRVIRTNDRVRKMISIRAPQIMIENEKRMLQQAVDVLFDNTKDVKLTTGRKSKCLADMLRGKQGRFRQNLLGKRVDYSGRSVVVVGPELKIHQCGVPIKMAMELFKPFIEQKLIDKGVVFNVKRARVLIEQEAEEVYEILDEVVSEHPVLLNRAPTLHRLGFQAFEPVLVEGKALCLHPLVCHAYNADFDGDQMAIHVPLSQASQTECWGLMLSARNLLNPANGEPIVFPSQDMVLGNYYLTGIRKGSKGEGKRFRNIRSVMFALESGYVDYQALITVQYRGKILETTPGRIIFSSALPNDIPFQNKTFDEKSLRNLISEVYNDFGSAILVTMLDVLKELGFKYSTLFGSTIGVEDIIIPSNKQELIKQADKDIANIQNQYQSGIITNEERYNRVVEIWNRTNNQLTDNLMDNLEKDLDGYNPIFVMAHSGARGSRNQIRQLGGMRGLMAKPSGDIIELPIRSNFKEGLSVLEFFISTNGARKGLADTALKTADAGYLTRRLVDIAQNVVVSLEDCGTINGIEVSAIKDGEEIVESLADRIKGCYTLERVIHPISNEMVLDINSEITEEKARYIEEIGIEQVVIRSVLTCEARHGVCQKCYGYNLATNHTIGIGEAVGVIAAQSIGQPGTQLTMRTFHVGGVATSDSQDNSIVLNYPVLIGDIIGSKVVLKDNSIMMTRKGYLKVSRIFEEYPLSNIQKLHVKDAQKVPKDFVIAELNDDKKTIQADKPCIVRIIDDLLLFVNVEQEIELRTGTKLAVAENQIVAEREKIAEFDIFSEPIISEYQGFVKYEDIIPGATMREEINQETGRTEKKIIETNLPSINPRIIVLDQNGEELGIYSLPFNSYLSIDNGEEVEVGQTIAKMPQENVKTRDITGGLPKISKLFEAHNPKEVSAVLAKIDGTVKSIQSKDRGRTVVIEDIFGKSYEHQIPLGRHMLVRSGDQVKAGELLCEGEISPHDMLNILGENVLQLFLINEIQEVYRLQGVNINDKHIGVIIRQMMRMLEVVQVGDTPLIQGQLIDRFKFREENKAIIKKGGQPAIAKPCLLGVKKASINVDSFLSAASFQETTKVLTNKAIEGAVDNLNGLKENLILGQLIPAGTGLSYYRNIELFDKDSKRLDDKVQEILEQREIEKEEIRKNAQVEEQNDPVF